MYNESDNVKSLDALYFLLLKHGWKLFTSTIQNKFHDDDNTNDPMFDNKFMCCLVIFKLLKKHSSSPFHQLFI